jgi:hypothetical protein
MRNGLSATAHCGLSPARATMPVMRFQTTMMSGAVRRPAAAVVAILIALEVSAVEAAPVSASRLPAIVRQHVKDINYHCSRSGGIPPGSPRLVRIIEITNDGQPDYLVDLSHYSCRNSESFMHGGHNGSPIWIFVGGPKRSARLAYDGYSHGVELTSGRGKSRLWLKVAASACGQPPGTARAFSDWWFCSRPLDWNGRTRRFVFAPLGEVRNIARPG